MTDNDKLAIQAEVAANPHLFSARHNKDIHTIVSVLNETRAADARLSREDVVAALVYRAPDKGEG